MSTRSTINFTSTYNGKTTIVAKIYRHSDGYPGTADGSEYGVLPDLHQFFKDVVEQTKRGGIGTRFNDAAYLAAKFVVWQAAKNAIYEQDYKLSESAREKAAKANPLNFLSVGIMDKDPGDIEYTYFINTDKHDEQGFPLVEWKAMYPKGTKRVKVTFPTPKAAVV